MSSAVVTDQKPFSSGYSVTRSVQWIGHWLRICLKTSCGGPSAHIAFSAKSTFSRSLETDAIWTSPSSARIGAAIILAGRPGGC